jgi:MerR family redox-sensitive transcriptional activator SoxR
MLSIGQVAKRADVAVSAIHFWERKQLIASTRNAGNQRQYSSDILRRIAVIKIAQQVGLTLEEIKDAMSVLPLNKAPTKQQWAKMSRQWHGTLQERITNLQKLSGQLDHCIGCGCLSMKSCQLYNPEDKLSEEGNGPQLW